MLHDLVLANGVTSGSLAPGQSATVDVGVIGTDLDGWCSVAGHRQLGMVMKVVASGAPTAAGDHSEHAAASGPSAAEDIDLMARPGAEFVARDPTLPAASAERVHTLTLTVKNVKTEVAPGVTQELWTYNGTAPGPTLRGKVGDVFDITLVNDGTIGHSVDFHAGALAPDKPMRTIAPGQSLEYRFTATRSGIWLYHCSTMPMSLHIANGMFGAVVIDPAGLTPVDREYLVVQSEYYLGPQGGAGDATKVATQKPDLVVFNGYANQYRDRPIPATVGEKVRVWVLDAGPNVGSAFHVVGGQFDTVFKEGDYLLKDGGSTGSGGAQALDLSPAQGGFVELTFPEAGDYSVLSHIMSDAEKGASGLFRVAP
jgi:nitrite reductase (NO-forming)